MPTVAAAPIAEDRWLTGVVGHPVFRVADDCPVDELDPHVADRGHATYFTRVATADTRRLAALTGIGFAVVDCGVTLTREPTPSVVDPPGVVSARPEHVPEVTRIGATAFGMSRFHLDPSMPPGSADAIKREWARNCASGGRGVDTLVALAGEEVAGFLAVLADDGDHVIDLVAVDAAHRGNGVGRALVQAFIARHSPRSAQLRVGTQAANVASLRLYEGLGFRVHSTHYALHLHT